MREQRIETKQKNKEQGFNVDKNSKKRSVGKWTRRRNFFLKKERDN